MSRLIEWFLHVDSDGIIFCSTPYLWHLNAGGPLQSYLAIVFRKNSVCAKMTRKKFFLLILKFLILKILLFRVWLNRLRFGIHNKILNFHGWTLCYNELFHEIRRKWKSIHWSMDLWHSNNMKVILTNFAT